MNADLLLDLANFLDKLPPERFKYNDWVGKDWGGKLDLSCGTTACALGWATQIPSIAAKGLRLAQNLVSGSEPLSGGKIYTCEGRDRMRSRGAA